MVINQMEKTMSGGHLMCHDSAKKCLKVQYVGIAPLNCTCQIHTENK